MALAPSLWVDIGTRFAVPCACKPGANIHTATAISPTNAAAAIAAKHRSTESKSRLVHACVRMSSAGSFIDDPLDSVSAAAALGAASEAGIDLAHAGPSRLFCNN